MSLTMTQMVAAVKRDLKKVTYTDTELEDIIEQVVVEVSDVSPYQALEVKPATANSKVVDISGLTILSIDKVEYPVGNSPRSFRNLSYIDNGTIEMDISSPCDTTGAASTLTGTVTFTTGSATVTGSGTDFDGELEADYLIQKSGGSNWYRVYSIESDTSLTLAEPVKSADNGADTVNLTVYVSEPIILYCDKLHTLSTTSTLNAKEERVVLLGSIARVGSQWLNRTKELIETAESRLTDNSTIETMAARVTQAIADLTSARTYINKINYGGSPQQDYIATSAREIQNAAAIANETGAFLRESQQYLLMSGQIRQYQVWVDRAQAEYKYALKTIVKRKVATTYSRG